MARARNIKPGFFKNEDLAECDVWARLCFAGLWTLADREGRLEDRPKRIKAELFAFDSIDVEPLLQELEKHGFIQRYVASESLGVIQILAFYKHQNPHHREPSSELPCHKSLGLSDDENASNQPEPEALPTSDATKAPNKPEALPPTSDPPSETSLEPAQDKPEALPSTSELSSPQIRADSGYSDSGYSDSGYSDSGTLIPEKSSGDQHRVGDTALAKTSAAVASATPKGHRLGADWTLPKTWGDWALAKYPLWTPDKVRLEAENFADYWHAKAGCDAVKIDWLATWRKWCRDPLAHRDDPKPGNGKANDGPFTPAQTEARNAESRRQLGFAPAQEIIDV